MDNQNVCERCGNQHDKLILTKESELRCPVCLEEENYVECSDCGTWISKDSALSYENGHICESCFESGYGRCRDCDEIIHSVSLSWVGHDGEFPVCEKCFENYERCDSCGNHYARSDIWASDDYRSICNTCSENYDICCDCRSIIHTDDGHWRNDNVYCDECQPNGIHEYNYKPDPIFLGSGGMYLGVELEVDDGDYLPDCANEISDISSDVYLKNDGSLNCGMEIVSHPATLDYHLSELDWKHIMHTCETNGFKSHDTSTCGFHVHVNRNFFGDSETLQDLNIAKLIILINRFWEPYIVPFSRRDLSALDKWAKKNDLDTVADETEESIIDKYKRNACRGRYQAINLTNQNTIEFRFFRGTLKHSTFVASLQFVKLFCEYAIATQLKNICTLSWEEMILKSGFKELESYCLNNAILSYKENERKCA